MVDFSSKRRGRERGSQGEKRERRKNRQKERKEEWGGGEGRKR